MKKIIFLGVMFGNMLMANIVANINQSHHFYAVILAGGSGERLWPLSRTTLPKQLLSVGNEKTLLEQAIDRAADLVEQKNILISTTAQHAQKIHASVDHKIGGLIIEPGSRNTGPAILLCCLDIYDKDPEAVIAFLPADPFIPQKQRFVHFLQQALNHVAHHDVIALLGLQPTFPATGYGYIEYNLENKSGDNVYPVIKFHEKPVLDIAKRYVAQGNMLWNSGMFCAKARVFIEEFQQHAPKMYADVQAFRAGNLLYEKVISDSVDYALMEKSNLIEVLPVDFTWCDVGNVEIFLSLKQQYDQTPSNVISIDANNNLVDVPGKLVALVGVDDLCIVEANNTLMITRREAAEKVKLVVKKLKENNSTSYL